MRGRERGNSIERGEKVKVDSKLSVLLKGEYGEIGRDKRD